MKKLFVLASIFILTMVGCSSDDSANQNPFVVAFEQQSVDFSTITSSKNIRLVFSKKATSNGSVTITIEGLNAQYGTDYTTIPQTVSSELIIPFTSGSQDAEFTFQNLIFPFDRSDKKVVFKITNINYNNETKIQGYSDLSISFEKSTGGFLAPQIGGPNQPNQIFVDLSKQVMTSSRRDIWDLGFYAGNDFRVILNGSLYMATKALNTTNLNDVTPSSVQTLLSQVAVGTFQASNTSFIDAPSGNLQETAISQISENPENNPVYLLNMGYEIGTITPTTGSVAIAGNERGWKKIKIDREGDAYKIKYADLNGDNYQEHIIYKNTGFNFTHFSLKNNTVVAVQPLTTNWDLQFTVFTNVIEGNGSYGYSDFVLNNIHGGALVYKVLTSEITFNDFNLSHINESLFTTDQRIIGADWRDVFTGLADASKYYIVKDTDGNYYELKMLSFLNSQGQRGYPTFEYKLIY